MSPELSCGVEYECGLNYLICTLLADKWTNETLVTPTPALLAIKLASYKIMSAAHFASCYSKPRTEVKFELHFTTSRNDFGRTSYVENPIKLIVLNPNLYINASGHFMYTKIINSYIIIVRIDQSSQISGASLISKAYPDCDRLK